LTLKNSYSSHTLFADTNALMYAFATKQPDWLKFIESAAASGHRFVIAEEILREFAGSQRLDAALHLTRSVVNLNPLWIRSFADIQSDEICHFAGAKIDGRPVLPTKVFVENFYEISQLSDENIKTPEEYVKSESEKAMREVRTQLAQEHANALDILKTPAAKKQINEDQAQRWILHAHLARGSNLTPPFQGEALAAALSFCVDQHTELLKACPSYATELHLADFRASDPRRKARPSDSNDYLMSIAAFPYVSIFLTNDGFLHKGLKYVQRHLPHLTTEIIRTPPILSVGGRPD
jgi:hypothetical protein